MTLDSLIMLGGSLVMILPFLGFPNSWDTIMFFILGVFIIALGIVVRRRAPRWGKRNAGEKLFVENMPASMDDPYSSRGHEES